MLIGLISDSHDNFQGTLDALEIFRDRGVDMILHAGDMVGSGNCYAYEGLGIPVRLVYGNNDGDRVGLYRDFARVGGEYLGDVGEVEAGGRKIALTHGTDEAVVRALVESGRYDVVVRGHNHRLEVTRGETLLVNPGEVWGHLTGLRSVALLETSDLSVEVVEMGRCRPFKEVLSEWRKALSLKT